MNKKLKIKGIGNGGITLIALVVTVIALLTLVGIAIRIANNTHIVRNTTTAIDEHAKGAEQEAVSIALGNIKIDIAAGLASPDNMASLISEYLQKTGYQASVVQDDSNPNKFIITFS